jgi:Leu/Phe-tRNA-protein transferase
LALALFLQSLEGQDVIVDTQVPSDFLMAMGARMISYDEYRRYLRP